LTCRGVTSVGVREYYTDAEGEEKPGKKGLNLDPASVATLREHLPQIDAHVASMGGGSSSAAAPPTPAAAAGAAPAPAATPTPQLQQQAQVGEAGGGQGAGAGDAGPSSAVGGAGGAEGGGSGSVIELGGDKRVTLSRFSGKTFVDIREWYKQVRGRRPCAVAWPAANMSPDKHVVQVCVLGARALFSTALLSLSALAAPAPAQVL